MHKANCMQSKDGEPFKLREVCGLTVDIKQLTGEMTQLRIELRNLKDEIERKNVVKDKELERKKEEILSIERIIEKENKGQQK